VTLAEFVDMHWRSEVAISFKPSTLRMYETMLRHHLLPYFGDHPLPAITRAIVKKYIAEKSVQQRCSRSRRNPNPNRSCLSPKTIKNTVALLSSILETATVDYELLDANHLRGILRRTQFPTIANRPLLPRMRTLEIDDFKQAISFLKPKVFEMVLIATLTGLRWGELVALRIDEDVDFRRNKLRITRSLYRRNPQSPKTEQSIREVDMRPTVRHILETVSRSEGLIFSPEGRTAIGNGSWIKRQWRDAQVRADVGPIRWHDLRHQFVSLLIAAGKHPKYISAQAGHASAGFTMDRYGHLLEQITPHPVEWIDDLLGGWDQIETLLDAMKRRQMIADGVGVP
jgi:integrase